MKKIFRQLTRGLENEIDSMPFGVSEKTLNRLVNKSLNRVIKKVGQKCGLKDVQTKLVKNLFWNCDMSFPSFDDECYISLLKGKDGGKVRRLGSFERINDNADKKGLLGFQNDILFNGEWGANYNSERREMLGGYSEDGISFTPSFRITDIDEEFVPNAIALCSILYSNYGNIDSTYSFLLKEFEKCHKEAS